MSRQRINRPEAKHAFIRIIKSARITQLLPVNKAAGQVRRRHGNRLPRQRRKIIKKQQRGRLESLEAQSQSNVTGRGYHGYSSVLLEFYFQKNRTGFKEAEYWPVLLDQIEPPSHLVVAPVYDTSPALSVLPGQRSPY